ncbi:MAG: hypothetical protein Q7U76_12770 [Nitrospirota bacterium]|nr:hypothetical protein [Nitrospirota bacterium]
MIEAPVDVQPTIRNELERAYRKWRDSNQKAYDLYVRFAKEALHCGKRFSISLLTERIRWEAKMTMGKDEEGYRINNNFRAYLARDLMEQCPELIGIIETRTIRGRQGAV